MPRYPELLLDPTIPNLPRGTPPARKPRRRLVALLLVVLGAGFVGGALVGALIGKRQATEAARAAEREAEIGVGVMLDLQRSVDFWRGQAMSCQGYDTPRRTVPEGGAI